ncbi:glutathione S-transferase family protein [Terricaulis sp.]|uniref:glutathione S-transferase family protein n=1 Tax=Terricaulis sp. TaxID=2768686 RepID=UPI0037834544
MLTIWGRASALNVQKVVWAADEIGVKYRRIDAGRTFGVVDTPEYRALNPNGKVPVIDDDGFVLWESNVIVRYLCMRHHREDLCPSDIRRRADAERWMDWQTVEVLPCYRVALALVRGLTPGLTREQVETAFTQTNALLSVLEAQLAKTAFVAGDSFTMGDIPIGLIVHNWLRADWPLPPFPNLRRWHGALGARPGAQAAFVEPLAGMINVGGQA